MGECQSYRELGSLVGECQSYRELGTLWWENVSRIESSGVCGGRMSVI